MRCRFCGSQSIQPDTEHKNFSTGKAVAGAVLVGPIGAVGGFAGKAKKGYRCAECGAFMETPMDLSTELSIDSAVRQVETLGQTDLLHYFQKQYPNVRANVKAASEPSSVLSVDPTSSAPDSRYRYSAVEGADLKQFHRNQTWQKGSPVFVENITIQTLDVQDVLSMTIWNQSEKSLRSVYFNAVVYDDTGDELSRLSCNYQKLSVAPGKKLPQNITFPLKTDLAYRVEMICDKVSFTDDSVWRNDNTPPIMFVSQTELTPENFPRLKYVRMVLNDAIKLDADGSIYLPTEESSYWQCVCGHPAEAGKACPHCEAKLDLLNKLLSQEYLREIQQKHVKEIAAGRAEATTAMYEEAVNADREKLYQNALRKENKNTVKALVQAVDGFEQLQGYKDAKERAVVCKRKKKELVEKAEADRLETERQAELARQEAERITQRNKKITKITIPIVCAVVGFIVLLNTVIIPNGKYTDAVALKEVGQYEEAITAFEAMGDYRDSKEQIITCENLIAEENYCNAVKLMEAEQYEEARSIFEVLVSYKDSDEKRAACEAVLQEQHLEFLALRREGAKNTLSVNDYHTVWAKSDGTVVATGYEDERCNVDDWADVVAVATGTWHTVGLKSDGTVLATGEDALGQCDVGSWTDITAISAAYAHTIGLKSDGTVIITGENPQKRLRSIWCG